MVVPRRVYSTFISFSFATISPASFSERLEKRTDFSGVLAQKTSAVKPPRTERTTTAMKIFWVLENFFRISRNWARGSMVYLTRERASARYRRP
ncbi:MAG: hypothetical protein BWY86_00888 [Candidatus Aminicenantes bacterium ADurb.Bin508]|nr:MAG: hypothetical protein BWY86_00888 [Candidatus Aminicenantes bacterium ADurb.Bin508]